MTAAEFAAGLRLIADHYDANPEMPVTSSGAGRMYMFCSTREEFIGAAVALAKGGKIEKIVDPESSQYPQFRAIRTFGAVPFEIRIDRKLVCRLLRPAEYECPDSLLEESKEYAEVK